jgi:hypothetical protein
MKKLVVLLTLFSCTFLLDAQNSKIIPPDTLIHHSSLGEVTDTVPDHDFFGTDIPLKIALKYDISSFIKNKSKGEYIDAELQVFYNEDEPVVKDIRIQARGNFRRGQCYFPPLSLNFKTDPIQQTELKGVKKIKVVTYCSSAKSSAPVVLKEFLAYKLYNILSDKSFRVRLLDIHYIDTGKKQLNFQEHGFIIEPAELVAHRNNCVLIDPMIITAKNLIEGDADCVAMFRYMISDTDWRIRSGHNIKFMKSMVDVTDKVVTLPYDFDFSGFVGASYADPQEWSDASSIYQRDYLGYCRDNDDDYYKIIDLYSSKQNEIMNTINAFNLLSEKDRKEVVNFTEDFFKEISNPKSLVSSLKRECQPMDF